MKLSRLLFLILLMSLFSLSGIVSAQGGAITYGETRNETLTPDSPQILYNLQGNAEDVVTVYVLGWVDGFQPSITILGPTGQLAFTSIDALTPIANDARVTVRLPQAGNYSILVGSATTVLDMFTIAVRNTTAINSTPADSAPATVDIPAGAESFAYTITASPDSETPLTISSTTPDFMFAGYISAPDGQVITAFDGVMSSFTTTLPADEGMYTIVVRAADPAIGGIVTVARGVAGTTPADTTSPDPVATEEVTTGGADIPADECVAIAGSNGTNVRTGPGTEYEILRILRPGDYLLVTAQNSGWYTDGVGWVAGSVITLSGPCDAIGVGNANPPPTATVTPLAEATAIPTDSFQPTASPTDTIIEATPTPTVSPTAPAPVAPIDSDQLNLAVDRDTGGTLNNDVSSPDGDTTDRVRITIDNLSNQTPNNFREISIQVICFGGESANLRWGTGGPNSPNSRSCNESITATHTNDSNQTFVNIAMEGPGYTQYALSVTILP